MNFRASERWLSAGAIRRIGIATRAIAIVGTVLFGTLTAVVTMAPDIVERAARGHISHRLRAEVDALRTGSPAIAALIPDTELAATYAARLRDLQQRASVAVDAILDKWLASMCKEACGDVSKTRALLHAALSVLSEDAKAALNNLQSIAQGRFDFIFGKLRHELTLISAINLVVFLLLLLVVTVAREQRLVVVPAAILATSTLLTLGIYVFGTNWWWAVLTDGYWGYGYAAVDAIVFALLVDIVLFRGTITGFILQTIGTAISLIPAYF